MSATRVAALVAIVCLAVTGCAGTDRTLTAADQVPQLTVLLHRVDAALAAHRFAAAREDLRRLKAETVRARDASDLSDADAARVLQAIERLAAMLPAPSATPSSTPTRLTAPTSAAPTRSSHPKPSAHAQTSTPTPTPSPTSGPSSTPSPSPSSTPSSSPTPTAGQTREASPTASPTGP